MRKQLLEMRQLKVSKYLKELANKSNDNEGWGNSSYLYDGFLRVEVENDILKVFFFLTEYIQKDDREPAFVTYFKKQKDDDITYDMKQKKWRSTMLNNLAWKEMYYSQYNVFISKRDSRIVMEYLGSNEGDFYSLIRYQRGIRERKRETKEKKLTDKWDKEMCKVPELPGDWEKWVVKTGVQQHFLLYQYNKSGVEKGYCTHCKRDVPVKHVKYNKLIKCSRCGQTIQCKSLGKFNYILTEKETVYLLQRCNADQGIVLRTFEVRITYRSDEYTNPRIYSQEKRRIIYDSNLVPDSYYYDLFKQREHRWIQGSDASFYYYYYLVAKRGKTYRKTLNSLEKNELSRTGIVEMLRKRDINPGLYFKTLGEFPMLEQIVKAGLYSLAEEIVMRRREIECKAEGALTDALLLDKYLLARLRNMNGGVDTLKWLQYEKRYNSILSNELIHWFCDNNFEPDDFGFIFDRMTPIQVKNYLLRQCDEMGDEIGQVHTTWMDYLDMAKQLNMDIQDSIIYRVRKLKQRHQELILKLGEEDRYVRAKALEEKYPAVRQIIAEIGSKYNYRDKEYVIVGPRHIEDILCEGEALHHCARTAERYFDRISNRESFILFLRMADEPTKPFYTLEIEPTGTIRQKRTEYDRQNDDINAAECFLLKWQKEIQERITLDDVLLAEVSKKKREKELCEIREKGVRISYGELRGQFLADVLEQDLMELVA